MIVAQHPAVDRMIELASKVSNVLGEGVQFPMRLISQSIIMQMGDGRLWADKNIDFVGIDMCFSLTSHLQNYERTYSVKDIEEGWSRGAL